MNENCFYATLETQNDRSIAVGESIIFYVEGLINYRANRTIILTIYSASENTDLIF